jgi:hypothetical protein
MVSHQAKHGQKPDALTGMPAFIPLKGGVGNTLQIVLKTENLYKELRKNLVVALMEKVNLDNDLVNPDELWNWIKNLFKQYPELYTHRKVLLEVSKLQQIQPTDEDMLKWIQNAMSLWSQDFQDEQQLMTC